MAFDKSKNIWVTTDTTAVVEFSPSELKELGSNSAPVPATTIISPMFGFLGGCSFDAGGNLWIAEFTAKQLKQSGTPMPPVVLSGFLFGSNELTFGPLF